MVVTSTRDVSFHAEALQSSVQIELPSYTGPLLSPHVLKSLQTEHHVVGRDIDEGTKGLHHREQVTLEVVNQLRTRFGDVCTVKRALLHHHFPDILFCVEQQGELKLSKCELELTEWRVATGQKWHKSCMRCSRARARIVLR
ncbi:hypothetical protein MTO96_010559 [Rhipicephalus appendiculatus]